MQIFCLKKHPSKQYTFSFRGGQQRRLLEFCSEDRVKHRQPTNGTVLSVPSLATFTLAVLTGAVLGAAGVAGALVAGCARPALLAATRAAHAHAVRAAVRRTDFCQEREAAGAGERERGYLN